MMYICKDELCKGIILLQTKGVVVATVAVVSVVSSVNKGNPSPGARALGLASPLPVSSPSGTDVSPKVSLKHFVDLLGRE